MSATIVRTLVVASLLPVGGERVYHVYVYDSEGKCYAYQSTLGSSAAAARVADATLEQDVELLYWRTWHTYTGDPLAY